MQGGTPVAPCKRGEGWEESAPVACLGIKSRRPRRSWMPSPFENSAFSRERRPKRVMDFLFFPVSTSLPQNNAQLC